MNLKEQLMAALKKSMQEKDQVKKDTIIMLRAAILQIEKDSQKELSEQDVIGTVAKEIKKRKDSIPDFERGNRPDLVNKIKEEINILEEYMPEQLSEEEIEKLVLEAINVSKAESIKDMGKVMQSLKEKTTGKADGKILSDIVRQNLSKL